MYFTVKQYCSWNQILTRETLTEDQWIIFLTYILSVCAQSTRFYHSHWILSAPCNRVLSLSYRFGDTIDMYGDPSSLNICEFGPLCRFRDPVKAPTNSQTFGYSFVNLLFDEEIGSEIFRGGASRWFAIIPARSHHVVGPVTRWLKTSSCSCHSVQGGSQFERKVLETLAKFKELLHSLPERVDGGDSSGLTMVWRPARCRRRRNPTADIGVTGMSTNIWRTTTRYRHGQTRIRQRNLPYGHLCQIAKQRQ